MKITSNQESNFAREDLNSNEYPKKHLFYVRIKFLCMQSFTSRKYPMPEGLWKMIESRAFYLSCEIQDYLLFSTIYWQKRNVYVFSTPKLEIIMANIQSVKT